MNRAKSLRQFLKILFIAFPAIIIASGALAKAALKMILGVVFVLLGFAVWIKWWGAFATVFKGCIGLFLIMAGAITIAIAKE